MVVDASVLLAILFEEPHAEWAIARLEGAEDGLRMSTVNLAEVLIRLRDRQPTAWRVAEAWVLSAGIQFVAPDVRQARIAAEARMRFPLNLGDCFAYALAVVEDRALIALDRDFRAVDCSVVLPPGS